MRRDGRATRCKRNASTRPRESGISRAKLARVPTGASANRGRRTGKMRHIRALTIRAYEALYAEISKIDLRRSHPSAPRRAPAFRQLTPAWPPAVGSPHNPPRGPCRRRRGSRRRRGCPSAPPRARRPARFVPAAPVARRPRRPLPRAAEVGGGDRLDASSSASSTAAASASTASSPRPPPPKGAGSAAAALQDATTPDELLAAAALPASSPARRRPTRGLAGATRASKARDASPRLARWLASRVGSRQPRVSSPTDRGTLPRAIRDSTDSCAPPPSPLVEPHEPSHDADTGGTDAPSMTPTPQTRSARWVPSRRRHTSTRRAVPSSRARSTTRGGPIPRASPSRRRGRRVDSASRPRPTRTHGRDAPRVRASPAVVGVPFAVLPGLAVEPKTETRTWRTSSTTTMADDRAARTNARWLPGEHIDARVTRRRRSLCPADASLRAESRRGDDSRSAGSKPLQRRPLPPSRSRSKP